METEFKNEIEMRDVEIVSTIDNTLFGALAIIVWGKGSEKDSGQMRSMIVDRLIAFPQKYNLGGKSLREYKEQCRLISKGNRSGLQLALQAIADITLAVVKIYENDDFKQPK